VSPRRKKSEDVVLEDKATEEPTDTAKEDSHTKDVDTTKSTRARKSSSSREQSSKGKTLIDEYTIKLDISSVTPISFVGELVVTNSLGGIVKYSENGVDFTESILPGKSAKFTKGDKVYLLSSSRPTVLIKKYS